MSSLSAPLTLLRRDREGRAEKANRKGNSNNEQNKEKAWLSRVDMVGYVVRAIVCLDVLLHDLLQRDTLLGECREKAVIRKEREAGRKRGSKHHLSAQRQAQRQVFSCLFGVVFTTLLIYYLGEGRS
jgi:hypothetical protein